MWKTEKNGCGSKGVVCWCPAVKLPVAETNLQAMTPQSGVDSDSLAWLEMRADQIFQGVNLTSTGPTPGPAEMNENLASLVFTSGSIRFASGPHRRLR